MFYPGNIPAKASSSSALLQTYSTSVKHGMSELAKLGYLSLISCAFLSINAAYSTECSGLVLLVGRADTGCSLLGAIDFSLTCLHC